MRGHRSEAFHVETDTQPESDSDKILCPSCKEVFGRCDATTCKICYEVASEAEEELKREIEDLKAKVAFLRFFSPPDLQHHYRSSTFSFTDVVLVPASDDGPNRSTIPVHAHKAILVSRSPVFKAMLENEMEESRSGTIKINDVSLDTLRAFVYYMYTAEACLDEQMAHDILVLADKY